MSGAPDAGLPSLLMEAARSAAVADGLVPQNSDANIMSSDAFSSSSPSPRISAPPDTNSGPRRSSPSKEPKGREPNNPDFNSTTGDADTLVASNSAQQQGSNGCKVAALPEQHQYQHVESVSSRAAGEILAGNAQPAVSPTKSHGCDVNNKKISCPTSSSSIRALNSMAERTRPLATGLINNRGSASAVTAAVVAKNSQQAPAAGNAAVASSSSSAGDVSAHRVNTAATISSQSAATKARLAPSVPAASPPSSAASQSTNAPSGARKKGPPLRRGKWTPEEEAYANRLIQEFKAGLLPLTDGTTLRTFLSKLLNCDPMRISKKFVGSNCIGKQVFRRRTAEINRLTPEQIQQSRAELSELERRFLERVAQTNRVKSSGVGGGSGAGGGTSASTSAACSGASGSAGKSKSDDGASGVADPPSPPWLRPPAGYKHGTGAATAAVALSGGGGATNNRAAAAGRALLQGSVNLGTHKGSTEFKSSKMALAGGATHEPDGLLAMAEMQQRRSAEQSMLQSATAGVAQAMAQNRTSANTLLAAAASGIAAGGLNGVGGPAASLSGTAMAQIAQNASAARLAGLAAAGNSMNNLLIKTGLSRDQLSQLAREQQLNSSASLSNMMERQSSFDALMSLDMQSLQSIDNLANLIQTGGNLSGHIPKSGMKNWDWGASAAAGAAAAAGGGSSGSLTSLANARRLASAGRMESLLRSLSSGNVAAGKGDSGGVGGSNANFNSLLQSVHNNLGNAGSSTNSVFGSGNTASALSLAANKLRVDSSTGLTALRMQDGLVQRNSSVDDFLSLVASGDIPHQDPHLLNVPLHSVMQEQQQHQQHHGAASGCGSQSGAQAAATYLAQQQLLAQAAASGGSSAFGNAIAARVGSIGGFGSLGNLGNSSSMASLLNQYVQSQSNANFANSAIFPKQLLQQSRASQPNMSASALMTDRYQGHEETSSGSKRKLESIESPNHVNGQGPSKR